MKKFSLKIIWLNTNLAIAIDHITEKGHSPLTSYFFWPSNYAWQELKKELESKPWILREDTGEILNEAKSIINYWQNNKEKTSIDNLKKIFKNCNFQKIYK